MSEQIDVRQARDALKDLPRGISHGEQPRPEHVYLPRSHLKAMDPDEVLVTGMRGAGKTFWWSALQNSEVRRLVGESVRRYALSENTQVRKGFGVTLAPDEYPGKDELSKLIGSGVEPRIVWRTVQARQVAEDGHPLRKRSSWKEHVDYVRENPGAVDHLFHQRDAELDENGIYFLVLFDALDHCADDWKQMHQMIRGLLQTALEMRSYRRLRIKVFLRTDQVSAREIADFPDASKILALPAELNWPRQELYGLLWHCLVNGQGGEAFRTFLGEDGRSSVDIGRTGVVSVRRSLISNEDHGREKFHAIAGKWMGRGPKRGFPYTWIPNHLGDAEWRVSPRSFLSALQEAAEHTDSHYPGHDRALHYQSIKQGVQEASKIRVAELKEDCPWVDRVLKPLAGLIVPCEFEEVVHRWEREKVLDGLTAEVKQKEVRLPPRHMDQGSNGVRQDLESLGIFQKLRDGRVNVPDVFRVGYGLGRRGGVKPILPGQGSGAG